VRRALRIAGGRPSACHICIRRSGLRIAASIVVFLFGVGFVSVAQLVVRTLQIGSRITLGPGSIGLLNESFSPGHFFRRLWPLRGTTTRETAAEQGGWYES
jgi:hypothetical protein